LVSALAADAIPTNASDRIRAIANWRVWRTEIPLSVVGRFKFVYRACEV
jgi:hypothetical protein